MENTILIFMSRHNGEIVEVTFTAVKEGFESQRDSKHSNAKVLLDLYTNYVYIGQL